MQRGICKQKEADIFMNLYLLFIIVPTSLFASRLSLSINSAFPRAQSLYLQTIPTQIYHNDQYHSYVTCLYYLQIQKSSNMKAISLLIVYTDNIYTTKFVLLLGFGYVQLVTNITLCKTSGFFMKVRRKKHFPTNLKYPILFLKHAFQMQLLQSWTVFSSQILVLINLFLVEHSFLHIV